VISGAKPVPKKPPVSTKLDPSLAQRMPLRILLCDDNAINQKVAMRLLQQMGYTPQLAANGAESLAAIDREPFDVIFMDVQMPTMDGFEATRQIRERQRDRSRFPNYKSSIIIVAMTANAMAGDRERCIGGGMDDYIAKPVRPEDVRTVIERWASAATLAEPPSPTVAQTATATQAVIERPAVDPNEAPVQMDRLLDFTNNNPDDLRELIALYLKQTGEQVEQLNAAVRASSAVDVRRLAHSAAGANATCGMTRIVPLLRELERQGDEGRLTNAVELAKNVEAEFKRIQDFLEHYLATHPDLART
jgi:CheY-like chemotaxis protein/HPt (histidine-containing phosphotransfer) domain-containing protein